MRFVTHWTTMETTKGATPSTRIRRALPDDLPFLRSLALEAFSIYGDYETILTDFFRSPGVHTYVAEEPNTSGALPVGILMMAARKLRKWRPYVAEVLAIAVDETRQGQGIGSHLIKFAKRWPLSFSGKIYISEVHLSVAASNERGQSFFERHGFKVFRTESWRYPAGQKAFRMRYVLNSES